jgi:RNA polymerase sigma-70 factor (ECF subfamily)
MAAVRIAAAQVTDAPERAERFSALFDRHYPAVWRFVARRVWPDAVDDVVAETFLAAWRRFDDLPSDPLPWLLNAAGKCLANHRRAATRAESLKDRLATESTPVRADATSQRQQRDALVNAFASLADTERALLMLTDWDGLPARRAARVLGIPAATASARIYRARKKLRAALADELGRPPVHTPVRSLP